MIVLKKEYLSKDNSNCAKGIFCVFILLAHLYTSTNGGGWGPVRIVQACNVVAMAMGYLSVAMFFFFSGYGLFSQYTERGREYLRTFPKKRMLPLYVNCVILIAVYTVLRILVYGEALPAWHIAQSFLWGKTVIVYGWYLQTILLLYVAFWAIFSLCRRGEVARWLMLAFLLVYALVCALCGIEGTWYEAVLPFWLGMVWRAQKSALDRWLSSKYFWKLSGAFIVFAVLFVLGIISLLGAFRMPVRMLSMVVFAVLVMVLLSRISVANPITRFFGKYSLEIYVAQGAVLTFLHSRIIYISHPLAYCAVAVPAVLLVALGFAGVFRGTKKLLKL